MPADEDVRQAAAIREGHHQLLAMPERDNHPPTRTVQGVDLFAAPHTPSQCLAEEPDQSGPAHRQQSKQRGRPQ
jgi:hypothetical protein